MAETKKQDMSIPDWPIDEELIATATAVLQAHERLSFLMRTKLQENLSAKTAIDDSNTILDSLRHLKSRIEGTQFIFQPLSLDHDQLVLLKHLVVAHTPENLQEQTKIKIVEKLNSIFKGQVKRIVYACILTCPWFARAQSEVSGQAKNNILFVVYVGRDEQFFSLATQHEKELCETWDEPPIFACEVRHFCAQLQRGNVRCVEALCSPSESLILSSPEWSSLITLIDPVALLHRTFIDRCVGQAMGALVKKRPAVSGRLVVRDDATLTKFCDSFRLLSYAESAIKRVPLSSWHDVGRNEEETEIISALNDAFEGLIHKEKLLQYIIKIKERVEEKIEDVPRIPPQWSEQLGEWLTKIRMDGVKISPQDISPSLSDDPLRGFLDSQGLTTLHSRDVIVIAKGGSMMYNLALPTSDIDYIVVYREPTERIISSSVNLKESMDNKGHKAETEMAAYEIRLFCEMLIKGAVNMFEMLFAEQLDYTSDYWKQLIAHKTSFMSEKVVLQYLGFVKTHMKMIEARKHEGTPRERKFFYQVFHKLLSLESYVQGGPPVVTCKDEDREYILQVRRGPLEGPLARDTLYAEAERRIAEVREKLMKREKRYQEFGDYRILQTWLLSVRGISLKEPLKMATPPLV